MFSVISLPVQSRKAVLSCRACCTFYHPMCTPHVTEKGNNKTAVLRKEYGRKRSVSTVLFPFVVQHNYNSRASQKLEAK